MKKRRKNQLEITPEREKYLKAYYENEADANKQMTFANALTSGVLLVLFFLYLFRVFEVHDAQRIFILIIFPVSIGILISPFLFF